MSTFDYLRTRFPKKTFRTETALIAVVFFCASLVFTFAGGFATQNNLQYYNLSKSFMAGRLDIPLDAEKGIFTDAVPYGGRFYWAPGPLPAVLMMPFAATMNPPEAISLFHLLLVALLFLSSYGVARRLKFSRIDSVWLMLAFCLGSVAIGAIAVNQPWQTAHVLTSLLLVLAVYEYLGGKRSWLIGSVVALAFLTRITAGAAIVFFAAMELLRVGSWKARIRAIIPLAVPLAVGLLIILAYNWLRFDDPFQNGYAWHLTPALDMRERLIRYGLFSWVHFPRNFYYYFLSLPRFGSVSIVNAHGISMFILCPIFLFAAAAWNTHKKEFLAICAVTLMQLYVFLRYFSAGYVQFGPRYVLDFLPLWLLLLGFALIEKGRGRLLFRYKMLISVSVLANTFLFIDFMFSVY